MKSTKGNLLPELVRTAAHAYENTWGPSASIGAGSDAWNSFVDENGRLLSPGGAMDGLVDFIVTAIGNAYDRAESVEECNQQIESTFRQAVGSLQEVRKALDMLTGRAVKIPYVLRGIVQVAGAGYTKGSINAWNRLMDSDGKLNARANFDDLLARFVILELGSVFEENEHPDVQVETATCAIAKAEAQLEAVLHALSSAACAAN